METIPINSKFSHEIDKINNYLVQKVNLPHTNPYSYNLSIIILSLACLYLDTANNKILLISSILFLYWLGQITIKQYYMHSATIYLQTILINLISEGLIFTAEISNRPGKIFFLLWIGNLLLSFKSLEVKKNLMLPLRLIYLMFLLIKVLI